ncbi:MAG: DNA repair protein RecO [Syntrophomonadaceae bacterium]|nr:DNA repair protein RecO [Syntrophomonadaceae bacterium]
MSSSYYQSRAIILKNMDYRESDKIVHVFTEKEGKVSAVARGIKKPKSSLRACVQPFCHSLLHFRRGREMELITQGSLIEFYANTREDISRLIYAVYIMELLDKSLLEKMPFNDLYGHTLQVLDYINQWGINSVIIRHFELQLLLSLGYSPSLEFCINCGSKELGAFNIAAGGAICEGCRNLSDPIYPISAQTLALLRLLLRAKLTTLSRVKATPASLLQLENLLEAYLEYHLERKFNLSQTIKKLKAKMMI